MTPEERICARPDCAKPFTTKDSRQRYCEHACAMLAGQRRLQGKDEWGNYPAIQCARPDCGVWFTPLTKKTHYCSSACIRTMASRRRDGVPLDRVYEDRDCLSCGTRFTPLQANSLMCSLPCQRRASVDRREDARRAALPSLVVRTCASPTCSNQFVPVRRGSNRRFCSSIDCERERQRSRLLDPAKRLKQRDAIVLKNIQKRMRAIGSTAEFDRSVTTTACIERFGTCCHWCGQEMNVERSLASRGRGDSVTIDHLLPITANGPHTWPNVVLACRRCNTEKDTDVCGSCGGVADRWPELYCSNCEGKERLAVCSRCGSVEMEGGWCNQCKAKGAGVWAATGLTKVKARKLSRELGFDPDRPGRSTTPVVDGWITWMVA